jgi:predicted porin
MMKKILAAAIVSAFAAPAFAATANVDISGKMAWDVTKMSGTGTPAENTYHLISNNSRISFKGTEDLGNGMKAGFALTYGLGGTGTAAAVPSSGSSIGGQEQFVFLSGNFGEFRAGVHDPLIKAIGRAVDLFADQNTGDARHLTAQGSIDSRADNVIAYISPKFSGFQLAVAHALDETTAANGGDVDMINATYSNGPLYLGLGYDVRDLANDQKSMRLGAAYTMGDLRVTGLYTSHDNVGGTATADMKVWGLGAGYKMGAITLKGQYYTLSDDRANVDTKTYAIGADYAFSKRTIAQLSYQKFKNDTGTNRGGAAPVAHGDTIAITNGSDPSRLALGIVHNF